MFYSYLRVFGESKGLRTVGVVDEANLRFVKPGYINKTSFDVMRSDIFLTILAIILSLFSGSFCHILHVCHHLLSYCTQTSPLSEAQTCFSL